MATGRDHWDLYRRDPRAAQEAALEREHELEQAAYEVAERIVLNVASGLDEHVDVRVADGIADALMVLAREILRSKSPEPRRPASPGTTPSNALQKLAIKAASAHVAAIVRESYHELDDVKEIHATRRQVAQQLYPEIASLIIDYSDWYGR